jgi:hypothetical protein
MKVNVKENEVYLTPEEIFKARNDYNIDVLINLNVRYNLFSDMIANPEVRIGDYLENNAKELVEDSNAVDIVNNSFEIIAYYLRPENVAKEDWLDFILDNKTITVIVLTKHNGGEEIARKTIKLKLDSQFMIEAESIF